MEGLGVSLKISLPFEALALASTGLVEAVELCGSALCQPYRSTIGQRGMPYDEEPPSDFGDSSSRCLVFPLSLDMIG